MTSDHLPNSREAAFALVALVLEDILDSDDADRQALLSHFMTEAWPSGRAERQ